MHRQLGYLPGYLRPRTREFYPMAYRQIGSVRRRVGTPICPQLRLTMVLKHTRASMPSSNPFPEEVLPLVFLLAVGEAVPLLLLIIHHGTHRRHPPDLAMAGAAEEEEVVGGVDNRWVQQPHGVGVGVAVPLLGRNRPPLSLLSKPGEVPQPP